MRTSHLLGALLAAMSLNLSGFPAEPPPEPGCTLNAQGRWEKRVALAPGVDLVLVQIPAGQFEMGSGEDPGHGEERPRHRVTIPRAFWMGRTEVTQAQWTAVAPEPGSKFKGEDQPVDSVTWDEAVAFLAKLNTRLGLPLNRGFRLPSEAEWEYACRAGTATAFSFGDGGSGLPAHGWYSGNADGRSHPVAGLKPNPWGLFDMHGNVWEWCQDAWNSTYQGAPTDGGAWLAGGGMFGNKHVLRGGAWYVNDHWCDSPARAKVTPDLRFGTTGFRVVLPG